MQAQPNCSCEGEHWNKNKSGGSHRVVTGVASFSKPPYYNPAILGIVTKSQDDPYKKRDNMAAAIVSGSIISAHKFE